MSDGIAQSKPWKDKELMFRLYYEDDYTYAEMANRFGCSPGTVSSWMKKHRAKDLRDEIDVEIPEGKPYRNAELMETLYVDNELSTVEISAVLECSTGAVMNWLDRHDIETRSRSEGVSLARKETDLPYYYTRLGSGYEIIKEGDKAVQAHRLQAAAYWGFEALKDKVVHHKVEIPWLNTEENLELLSTKEHQNHHKGKMSWLDRLRATEMYDEGASSYDLAPIFGVAPATVINNIRRVDPSVVRGKQEVEA